MKRLVIVKMRLTMSVVTRRKVVFDAQRFLIDGQLRCAKWIRLLGKNHSAPPPTLPSKNRKKFIFFLSKSTSIDYLLIFFIQKLV